jgi:hypothetical protein
MPFLTYQLSEEQALRNAGRLFQEAGFHAVKLEGGSPVAAVTRRLVDAGIPVMGHVGMTPQSVHRLGGFGAVGKTEEDAARIIEDARCSIYEVRPAVCADYPHLYRNFRSRLWQVIDNAETCPIVYNVVERLKKTLDFVEP